MSRYLAKLRQGYLWFPNSRTSDDIDIKLGSVTKLGKKNTVTSNNNNNNHNNINNNAITANSDVIFIFSIYGQFEATLK